jgi:DNA-binding LacI/PurR family transcriptional regulator
VSPETRRRVLAAVERLGYRPNGVARQFVRGRTNIVGVLVGGLDNPFYAEMTKRVERAAFARGYMATLSGRPPVVFVGLREAWGDSVRGKPRHVTVPTQLVVRGSTGPP